jgi:hypothetical protein
MNKYARFFAILKQVNSNGIALTKQEAVLGFTDHHTDSLSSLSPEQLSDLETSLSSLISQRQLSLPPVDPTADSLRKGIISQFKSIGRDVQAAKDWAQKYGVQGQKKRFNDYTNQELYLLFQNAKKMKRDHIKSISRR